MPVCMYIYITHTHIYICSRHIWTSIVLSIYEYGYIYNAVVYYTYRYATYLSVYTTEQVKCSNGMQSASLPHCDSNTLTKAGKLRALQSDAGRDVSKASFRWDILGWISSDISVTSLTKQYFLAW